MTEYLIDGMAQLQAKLALAGKDVVAILDSGRAAELIAQQYDEEAAEKRRTIAQNRLIYRLYQRIGKTLYGGDESLARNECKLRIGCRILYRDSKDFAITFDRVIRPLDHETRLNAMTLISVSSIMKVKQSTEYIKTIMQEYGARQVYFLDLEGVGDYVTYPEANQ